MNQVQHSTRRYGELVAVDDVSFHIEDGDTVGLLGHNGAGKITIMKMLTGILKPTAGTLCTDQLELGKDTRAIQAHRGYLSENAARYPEMTVIDCLDHPASLDGVADAQCPAAIGQACPDYSGYSGLWRRPRAAWLI